MVFLPPYLGRMKLRRIELKVISLMVLIVLFPFNEGRAQSSPSTPLVLAKSAIDNYDQTDDIDTLRWALNTLKTTAYETGYPLSYSYLIAEAEVKEIAHQLKHSKGDAKLSGQAKSRIWDLWRCITRIEESNDPSISSREIVKVALQRGVFTIIEAAKFIEHPNSLSPLIRNIINRAKKYNLVSTTPGSFAGLEELRLTQVNDFLKLDYPNAVFLSNVMKTDELIFVYKGNIISKTEDSLRRKEASEFAIKSANATEDPKGKCIAYYLAALGKEKEDPDTAIFYYQQAVDRLDKLEGVQNPTTAYLSQVYNPSTIIVEYTQFIYAYGKKLEDEGNYLRHVTLLENASEIKGLIEGIKCTVANKLQKAYPKLIDQLRKQGKDEFAESFQKKMDKIYIYYINTCEQISERR